MAQWRQPCSARGENRCARGISRIKPLARTLRLPLAGPKATGDCVYPRRRTMKSGIILWLLGVPLTGIILLKLFGVV
ncbi:hypothetical protein [Tahibacter amnicola]|uniref:Uncharacterized protein n=1 Tax=Tahibacter amnicola TaxID=2976241 RepID=A0ABY6BD95_9GAMM|nr:hypothetical protein [Tahibacter amnicola]UXI67507.1 hypothetical protein N4264_22660 [Tahibacter amnicola]